MAFLIYGFTLCCINRKSRKKEYLLFIYIFVCSAEDHPKTDYPEEEEEEEEEDDDDDDDDESEEEKSEASDESDDEETSKRHVRSVLGDDEFDDYAEDVYGYSESDEEFES